MTDSTKTGLAVGGAAALIGLVASFLCYKEGHLEGFSEGQAKGADLFKKKYETLKQKCEEQSRQVLELERLKQEILNDQAAMKATAGELCNKLRGLVSEEVYQRILANINRKGIVEYLDEAATDLKEGVKAVEGSAARGRVTGARKFGGVAWRTTSLNDIFDIKMPGSSQTRIVFSTDVCGWYFWPMPKKSLLPDDSLLALCPKFVHRIQELIPGWSIDERISYAGHDKESDVKKMDYDFMAICANALSEVEGRTFLCEKVDFYATDSFRRHWDWDVDEKKVIDLDYRNGMVKSDALDGYINQKFNEVSAALNAFWIALSADERAEMEECRRFFESIDRNVPVEGTVCVDGDTPVVKFCGDIKIPIGISDDFRYNVLKGMYLHFEGEGLYVSTNEDLRELLLDIIPDWKDFPISDSRIVAVIENRRRQFQYFLNRRPQLPARGAVREFLRFEDTGMQLMNKVVRQFVGQKVVCQRVTIKRKNGFVTKESLAESDEVNQILQREFDGAQCRLNDFASSRNSIMYSRGDLLPDFTDSYYYKKWARFERMATLPRLHVGDVVSGVVRSIKDYGAFIDFDNTSGLLHISEISDSFIKDIRKVLSVGQQISARVISIENGKIGLSTRKRSSANHKRKVDHSEDA